jgi:hypothetical protein
MGEERRKFVIVTVTHHVRRLSDHGDTKSFRWLMLLATIGVSPDRHFDVRLLMMVESLRRHFKDRACRGPCVLRVSDTYA